MKTGLLLAAAVGVLLLTVLIGWVGAREVLSSLASVGWGGFAAFVLYWLLVMAIVGLAWLNVAPGAGARRLGLFIWGRMLREAASDLLPFSQLGGVLVGARGVSAAGVPEELVFASTLVDLTAEIAAQIFYTLLGIALIIAHASGRVPGDVLWPAIGAVAVLFGGAAAFLVGQRRAVTVIGAWAARWLPESAAKADATRQVLDAIYADRVRIAGAVTLHVLGWIAGGVGSWIALHFMGVHAPLWAVIAMESLMYAVRNIGFALPGGLGVQEAAYVLLAPIVGLHPSHTLALSLLRRARDLVLGVPVLMAWQAREGRLLLRRRLARPLVD